MKKYIEDLTLVSAERIGPDLYLMKLTPKKTLLPKMIPGQFVEVKVENATTFLRRPISINFVDKEKNQLWLLIHAIGDGTRTMVSLPIGTSINLVYPLGNGFTIPAKASTRVLLVGGGVGTAPMLYLGAELRKLGFYPSFLLGARTLDGLSQLDQFEKYGKLYITTEDGSIGEKGFVTQHSVLKTEHFDTIYSCGPKPMMMSVASYAKRHNIDCEVSLENKMACGLGACLCCVENTQSGHVCACTDGPVFNINQLTWQI